MMYESYLPWAVCEGPFLIVIRLKLNACELYFFWYESNRNTRSSRDPFYIKVRLYDCFGYSKPQEAPWKLFEITRLGGDREKFEFLTSAVVISWIQKSIWVPSSWTGSSKCFTFGGFNYTFDPFQMDHFDTSVFRIYYCWSGSTCWKEPFLCSFSRLQ